MEVDLLAFGFSIVMAIGLFFGLYAWKQKVTYPDGDAMYWTYPLGLAMTIYIVAIPVLLNHYGIIEFV